MEFIKYAAGSPTYYFGLIRLSPILIAYVLKLVPNHVAKEKMLSHFFKGWTWQRFESVANTFARTKIDPIVRPKALERIRWHQTHGDRIIVVSASIETWIEAWCQKEGIELLATRLETSEGIITGRFATPNCHGEEKVRRIRNLLEPDDYDRIFAYGDTKGDLPMLSLAHERFFQPFKRGSST